MFCVQVIIIYFYVCTQALCLCYVMSYLHLMFTCHLLEIIQVFNLLLYLMGMGSRRRECWLLVFKMQPTEICLTVEVARIHNFFSKSLWWLVKMVAGHLRCHVCGRLCVIKKPPRRRDASIFPLLGSQFAAVWSTRLIIDISRNGLELRVICHCHCIEIEERFKLEMY